MKHRMDVTRLTKKEICWLWTHRCVEHGHRYLEHASCYFEDIKKGLLKHGPIRENVGFLDIEASNLSADFGYIFSYAIKPLDREPYLYQITPEDIRSGKFDRYLIEDFNWRIRDYDRIITYWGKNGRFDIPYLRTRALHHGVPFPEYKSLYVEDCYDLVKRKLKLSRNRLENVCNFFNIPAKQHKLNPEIWQKAMAGDWAALDHIGRHNLEDVVSLEAVWTMLYPFEMMRHQSI